MNREIQASQAPVGAISQFDKPTLKQLSPKLEAALEAVAREYGLSVRAAGGTYEQFSAKLKFEFKPVSEEAQSAKARVEEAEFRQFASVFGLKPDDYGKSFIVRGVVYKICGLSIGSNRFPVIGVDGAGKRMKFPADQTVRLLALAKGVA